MALGLTGNGGGGKTELLALGGSPARKEMIVDGKEVLLSSGEVVVMVSSFVMVKTAAPGSALGLNDDKRGRKEGSLLLVAHRRWRSSDEEEEGRWGRRDGRRRGRHDEDVVEAGWSRNVVGVVVAG